MRSVSHGFSVAGFLVVGALSFVYLFGYLGEAHLLPGWGYLVSADFGNATGLEPGASVEIAGVQVGRVAAVSLKGARAQVTIALYEGVSLQEDAIASIRTKGLLGNRYVHISLGGSDNLIPAGGTIRDTESPLDIPRLLAAYVALKKNAATTESDPPRDHPTTSQSLSRDNARPKLDSLNTPAAAATSQP